MSVSFTWGTDPEERLLEFPCDRYVERFDAVYYRGVTIRVPPEVVFRWLCQLRIAPYSYDWIDNLGRESPRKLTPGLDNLAIGQQVMGGFEVIDYELNRHLTIRTKKNAPESRIFGEIVGSYLLVPQTTDCCRLLVKLAVRYPPGAIGRFMRLILPWGDTIMMRRQLLNFKSLSERGGSSA